LVWLRKVRVIQDVKSLSTELNVEAFLDLRILRQRKIDVFKSRAFDDVAPRISKAAQMASKCLCVEEGLRRRIVELDRLTGNDRP
jgi:hypothetical protein